MRRLTTIIASTGLLIACGGSDPAADAAPPGVEIEEPLAFSAITVDGAQIDVGEFAGQDVLLWFWAPW